MSAGQIWSRYVRYIGAGAVAAAGIMTLIRSIPTMVESFRVGTAPDARPRHAITPRSRARRSICGSRRRSSARSA